MAGKCNFFFDPYTLELRLAKNRGNMGWNMLLSILVENCNQSKMNRMDAVFKKLTLFKLKCDFNL